MKTPLLSIGLIFRDDIRCIERCLKALQPLRDAVPCELVMADTGSKDGSRAIAEKYADILFDFPWIDDFSAARNAVMDRSSGKWYLSVDTDEYLDKDCLELVQFLRSGTAAKFGRVLIRNYDTYDMDGSYADFLTTRLVLLSTGVRYEGAIHETMDGIGRIGVPYYLPHTIFHHDGYVGMKQNTEKLNRNLKLLREKLRADPNNLLTHLQLIESGTNDSRYPQELRKSVSLVRRKVDGWNIYGPPILRYAVIAAKDQDLPEFQKWLDMAKKWFPDSYYTRIDIAGQLQVDDYEKRKYADCIARGAAIQAAYDDYFSERRDLSFLMVSTLRLASPYFERNMKLLLAASYIQEKQAAKGRKCLEEVDIAALDKTQLENFIKILFMLQDRSQEDTEGLACSLWEALDGLEADLDKAKEKRAAFSGLAMNTFTKTYRAAEIEQTDDFCRHAYTLFLPLRDQSVLGIAAAVMQSNDPAEIEALLRTVENWAELPISALSHALRAGVPFPLPGRTFCLEEIDGLTSRLVQSGEDLSAVLKRAAAEDFAAGWQSLLWVRSLVLAVVQNCGWKDERWGMELAQIFAKVEEMFLTRCYTPEILQEENLYVLPPMHRFGWYCVRAFAALDAGDTLSYVRFLRAGLNSYEGAKPMAEFLLDHTPQLQAPPPSPELLALAEKVKTMLAAYPADDPAVEALKASEVYQKVAYLIEGESI